MRTTVPWPVVLDVRRDRRELQVGAGHLGDRVRSRCRLVLEEVVVRAAGGGCRAPGQPVGVPQLTTVVSRRHGQTTVNPCGDLAVELSFAWCVGVSELLARVLGPGARAASSRRRGRTPSACPSSRPPARRSEGRRGWRVATTDALRRRSTGRHERRLEVVELELRGLADDLRGLRRVVHAGELDHDLVRCPACGSRARTRRACRCGCA